MSDSCVAFLFLFLPVVSSEFGIGSSRGISGLNECPSEEFSATGFWDVSFGFFPCGFFGDGDNTGVSSEFTI